MNELKVTGREKVGSIEFTGIEGGFGDGKRAMLVKDIATIHDRKVFHINELINRNRKRFSDGVDIVDLKSDIGLSDNEILNFGFTQNSFNASKNIYILSERGYSKLLKILEDDLAWDLYDQLVDGYFNMRQAQAIETHNLSPELQLFQTLFTTVANQELATKRLEGKVDGITQIVGISSDDWRKDSRELINKMARKQGGAQAYQEIQREIYHEVDRRAASSLSIRLENLRKRMARQGVSKTRRNKMNFLDVIEEDKRLKEIYLAIVKEFAVKLGV